MRLILIFLFTTLNVNATVVPKLSTFLQSVDEVCKSDVKKYDFEITKDFHRNIILMEIDNIDFDIELRKQLINDGAIASQRLLDANLFIKISSILEYEKIDTHMRSSFSSIKEKLETHPLAIESRLNQKLNETFIQLAL
jgi:hypothetical protein